MERRAFLKQSCSFCLAAATASLPGAFSSCASLPVYEAALQGRSIRVPQSLFADSDTRIVRVAGMDFDIGLKKEADGSYAALLMRCTHASNPLTFTGSRYVCSLHGSEFDGNGNVRRGPARIALQRLPLETSGTDVVIIVT